MSEQGELKMEMADFYLDAYGHLLWAVGIESWIACADAARIGDQVAYQVVVDGDHFVETTEDGILTLEEAREKLPTLLEHYLDICSEHLAWENEWYTQEEDECNAKTIESWKEKIEELLK